MNGRNRERLRQAREALGWSQEEVAKVLGTTQSTIHRWESGEETPHSSFRHQLCELFEKSPEALDLEDMPELLLSYTPTYQTIIDPWIPLLPHFPLVGREQELTQLRQQLCADSPVMLQGLPGMGKTTLACALAYDSLIRTIFPDGVLWVGLGVHPDLQYQLIRWGTLLGLSPTALSALRNEDRQEALQHVLEARQMLLVIDDAWTVEDAQVFQLAGPRCATLITTRFPTLAASLGGNMQVLRELNTEESLDLLHLLVPQVVEREPQQVRLLAETVGGSPLALTLTGNYLRTRTHTGQDRRIQAALEQVRSTKTRLHLSEPQGFVDRHPSLPDESTLSLHSVIAVSDQHLSAEARTAFYALSVLPCKPASFSEATALAVCGCPVTVLKDLIEIGLLERMGEEGRYALHQTIFDYARTRLTSPLPHDHLLHYAWTLVETHQTDYELLDQESSTILGALEAAYALDKQQELVRGVRAFVPFLLVRGNYPLAQLHLLRAQHMALALSDSQALVSIYLYLGDLAGKQGDYDQSQNFLQQGLDLARQFGNPEQLSSLLSLLSRSLWKQGKYDQAETYLQEGLMLAQQIGYTERMGELLDMLGAIAASKGDYAQSETHLQEGLRFARKSGDRKQICLLLMNLGVTVTEQGQYEQACACFEEGLVLARQIGHSEWTSALLCNLGAVATFQEKYAQAAIYQREGLVIARQIGHREWMSILLLNLGETAVAQGNYIQAALYLQETLKLAQQLHRPQLKARALYEQGNLHLKQQEIEEAEADFREMLDIIPQGDFELQALAQYSFARLSVAQGDIKKARQLGEECVAAFDAMGHREAKQVRQWLDSIIAS